MSRTSAPDVALLAAIRRDRRSPDCILRGGGSAAGRVPPPRTRPRGLVVPAPACPRRRADSLPGGAAAVRGRAGEACPVSRDDHDGLRAPDSRAAGEGRWGAPVAGVRRAERGPAHVEAV